MPHDSTCMSRVKNPTERFCEVISRVQNAGTMYELDFESFFPVLDHKIQYINVPRALDGLFRVDHLDGGHVIFEESGRTLHRETKVGKDRRKVFCSLRGGNRSNKFGLSRAGGSDSLSLRLVRNGSARKDESIPSGCGGAS